MTFSDNYQNFLQLLQNGNYILAYECFLDLKKNTEFKTKLTNSSHIDKFLLALAELDTQSISLNSNQAIINIEILTLTASEVLEKKQTLLKNFHDNFVAIQHLTSEEINLLSITMALSSTIGQDTRTHQETLPIEVSGQKMKDYYYNIVDLLDRAQDSYLDGQSPEASLIAIRKTYFTAEQYRQQHNVHSSNYWLGSILQQYLQIISNINQIAVDKSKSFLPLFLDETKYLIEIFKLNNNPTREDLSFDILSSIAKLIEVYCQYAIREAYANKKSSSISLISDARSHLVRIKALQPALLFKELVTKLEVFLKETSTNLVEIYQKNAQVRALTFSIFAPYKTNASSFDQYFTQMKDYLSQKNYLKAQLEFVNIKRYHFTKFLENINSFLINDEFLSKALFASNNAINNETLQDALSFYQTILDLLPEHAYFFAKGVIYLKYAFLCDDTLITNVCDTYISKSKALFTRAINHDEIQEKVLFLSDIGQVYLQAAICAYQNDKNEYVERIIDLSKIYFVDAMEKTHQTSEPTKQEEFFEKVISHYFGLLNAIDSTTESLSYFIEIIQTSFEEIIYESNNSSLEEEYWQQLARAYKMHAQTANEHQDIKRSEQYLAASRRCIQLIDVERDSMPSYSY